MQGIAELSIRNAARVPARPWKNGGGATRELAVFPVGAALDDFVWRVSLADVVQDGPFSTFAGVDRTIVALDGAGFHLDFAEGGGHLLDRLFEPFAFAGEASVSARMVGGASRDFNLMVMRERAVGSIEVLNAGAGHLTLAPSDERVLVYVARGALSLIDATGARRSIESGSFVCDGHGPHAHGALRRLRFESAAADAVALSVRIKPAA